MTLPEIIKVARRDSNTLFTREFHKNNGFTIEEDVYRVNIKGRINKAFKEYAHMIVSPSTLITLLPMIG